MESDKYGFPAADLEEATEEARRILVRTARAEMKISYSGLAEQVQAIPLEPHSAAMDGILSDLSEEEDTYGRGMTSVIIVHEEGGQKTGQGLLRAGEEARIQRLRQGVAVGSAVDEGTRPLEQIRQIEEGQP